MGCEGRVPLPWFLVKRQNKFQGSTTPHPKFWDEFWKNRCVSIEDSEPEVEVSAAANEPPVEGADAEDGYGEYFAMIYSVIEAGEAALGDARERK